MNVNELIRHKMLFDRNPILPFYEDKYHAKILAYFNEIPSVPLLYHCDSPSLLIDYLHETQNEHRDFVIKTNHGCGDYLIVNKLTKSTWKIKSKNNELVVEGFDELLKKIFRHTRTMLHTTHSTNEWAVAMIWPRRILVEPYIALNDDYKVMTSDGQVLFTYCCTARHSGAGLATGIFNKSWEFMGPLNSSVDAYGSDKINQKLINHFPPSPNLNILYDYAERLCPADTKMQRIDFYMTKEHGFLLGEITAYSGAGITRFSDEVITKFNKIENKVNKHLIGRICDNQPQVIDRTACIVPVSDNETHLSDSALKKAYFATIRGFEIVVNTKQHSVSKQTLLQIVDQQKKNPGKINYHQHIWSWDRHVILTEVENRIVRNKLTITTVN